MDDWSRIRFLESIDNLRSAVRQATGREPSLAIARDIIACLQQGRLFFEAAADSPLQIKPLQVYYGVVGFAKAIILANRVASIATIAQSHGLSETSRHNTCIEDLTARFHRNGLFSQFADTIAALGRLSYYDEYSRLRFIPKPFDQSVGLAETGCTLRDVLSRVPGLERLYENTFHEQPGCWHINFFHELGGRVQLRLDDPTPFAGRIELAALVEKWRTKFPFLRDWRLQEATRAWGYSIMIFDNLGNIGIDEFSPETLVETNNGFGTPVRPTTNAIPFERIVPPLAGGIVVANTVAMQPLNGVALSEYALQFCGAFLLSSLVRYRPQTWLHALSHSAVEGRRADDRAISLIEKFLDIVLGSFPTLAEKTIDWANSHDLRA